jgi:hypothetical protein
MVGIEVLTMASMAKKKIDRMALWRKRDFVWRWARFRLEFMMADIDNIGLAERWFAIGFLSRPQKIAAGAA